ncbi:DUF2750 domain-containing protein [Cupriavidus basilensis]
MLTIARGSTMKVNQRQLEAVFALPGPKRFEHFVKVVCDWEEVWGLFKDGWALAAADDDGTIVFPVWPAKEYALHCAEREWLGYEPRKIGLTDFLENVLANSESRGNAPRCSLHANRQRSYADSRRTRGCTKS